MVFTPGFLCVAVKVRGAHPTWLPQVSLCEILPKGILFSQYLLVRIFLRIIFFFVLSGSLAKLGQ